MKVKMTGRDFRLGLRRQRWDAGLSLEEKAQVLANRSARRIADHAKRTTPSATTDERDPRIRRTP
jgi:hypothetical protein